LPSPTATPWSEVVGIGTGSAQDTAVDGNGRVTPDALTSGLTDAQGRQPEATAHGITPGVYVGSSDGSSITGGGIYVNGDADISLTTAGDTQTIDVTTQGTRSTITIDYASNTTTLTTGGTSRTFQGVPTDSSYGPGQSKAGTSLFVNGSVTSLSGPSAVDGATAPALGPKTALTITAQRNIRITGDIKYSESVVGPDGAPVPRANQIDAVLGIYTNDGNVELAPDPSRTDGDGLSLEIDAAIAAFNSNTGNDGGKTEGSIVFTGAHLPGGARLRIVGARIQSNIANIKYRNRQVYFDPRLDNGNFAPPFFPGIDTGKPSSTLEINFQGEQAVVILADGWQRDERRKKKSGD
jgi:hypothetical protein